jgi:hypothetical protein
MSEASRSDRAPYMNAAPEGSKAGRIEDLAFQRHNRRAADFPIAVPAILRGRSPNSPFLRELDGTGACLRHMRSRLLQDVSACIMCSCAGLSNCHV